MNFTGGNNKDITGIEPEVLTVNLGIVEVLDRGDYLHGGVPMRGKRISLLIHPDTMRGILPEIDKLFGIMKITGAVPVGIYLIVVKILFKIAFCRQN